MESVKARRRSALYKSIAVAMTLIFHVGLFGGIYYMMDESGEEIELVDEEQSMVKNTKQQSRS